jgi:glutathione S-transferase
MFEPAVFTIFAPRPNARYGNASRPNSAAGAASVADAYLYVMLRWARMQGLDVPEPLPAFIERIEARPAVRQALQHEGLA